MPPIDESLTPADLYQGLKNGSHKQIANTSSNSPGYNVGGANPNSKKYNVVK
jgi:hypothetical protein